MPLKSKFARFLLISMVTVFIGLLAVSCAQEEAPTLRVGGIPDQDAQRLARRYEIFADYLSKELDVPVEYVPSVSYSAVVTAFSQNDVQLAFFGALTGVQARLQNPGAQAIVQRAHDAEFHSKYVVRAGDQFADLNSLDDLVGKTGDLTITFGSESSTSGHLMPRYFLGRPALTSPTISAHHRGFPVLTTKPGSWWRPVPYDVGALAEDVWERAVTEGNADPAEVRELDTTPNYVNYNWTARADFDEVYGDGFTDKVQAALLALNPQEHGEILELFSTERFIATENDNYQAIESVARELGIIQ